jgi:tRNA 5-methylaminomethyl-2-thiouridine biosynthesis bifunctional protein
MATLTPARLALTADGIPYSVDYDDVYHSAAGAAEQARHVFLAGNGLPERWHRRERFVILETGFGLGNNFLSTWQTWRDDTAGCERLWFVSLEKHPLSLDDWQRLPREPGLQALADQVAAQWPPLLGGWHRLEFERGRVQLLLYWGEALQGLEQLQCQADAVYLDGFAPAKNAELWQAELMQHIACHTRQDATLATYSAARSVRNALSAVGFQVSRQRGFAGKRDMTVAYKNTTALVTAAQTDRPRTVTVLGAGLAGCSVANRLAARGCQVTLIDALPELAQATSGNRMGAVQPVLARHDTLAAQWTRSAYFDTLRMVSRLRASGQAIDGQFQGLLHLAKDEHDAQKMQDLLREQNWPPAFVRWVNVDEASALAGVRVARGGYWFAQAGWLKPASYCRALVQEHEQRIECRLGAQVETLAQLQHDFPAQAYVLAHAYAVQSWYPALSLQAVRGQLSHWPEACFQAPRVPVAGDGYVMPAHQGLSVVGATYEHDSLALDLRDSAQEQNRLRLQRLLPGQTVAPSHDGRAGVRTVMRDRLPILGCLDTSAQVYVWSALASRGITWASLGAETLVALLCHDPLPIPKQWLQGLAPWR